MVFTSLTYIIFSVSKYLLAGTFFTTLHPKKMNCSNRISDIFTEKLRNEYYSSVYLNSNVHYLYGYEKPKETYT